MLVVGLTGGIGAGKSQLARLLSQHGAAIIDTDQIVHSLLAAPGEVRDEVARAFPEAVHEGEIDRKKLAERVFSDAQARRVLESILHPVVFQKAENTLQQLKNEQIVVIEVPLLLEAGTDRYDMVVAVLAPEEQRRDRMRELGMSPEQVDARISAQVDDKAFRAAADVVIVNDADPQELERKASHLWEYLAHLNAAKIQTDSL